MKQDWVYRRGDLYLADLGKPEGSEQGGVRPVVARTMSAIFMRRRLRLLH